MGRILVVIAITVMCITASGNASAVEPLNYSDKTGPTLRVQLSSFLKNTYDTALSDYQIADIDLNNDGIDEYILKQRRCSIIDKSCTHLVIAEKQNEIFELSRIKAQNLMVGGTLSHGIKDLLAFNDEINDYKFDIYVWSPPQKMYIIKAE